MTNQAVEIDIRLLRAMFDIAANKGVAIDTIAPQEEDLMGLRVVDVAAASVKVIGGQTLLPVLCEHCKCFCYPTALVTFIKLLPPRYEDGQSAAGDVRYEFRKQLFFLH